MNELWKFTDTDYKVYVEHKSAADKIKKVAKTDISTIYYLKGKEVGWDLIIDKKYLSKVKKIISN